jgi:hypothetical protein
MRVLRRPIACIVLAQYLVACYTMPVEPKTTVAGKETIRVTVTSAADTVVWQVGRPWIRNDTLGGAAAACRQGCESAGARWPVPVSEVVDVQSVHDHSGKVVAAVFLAALVAGILAMGDAMADLGR